MVEVRAAVPGDAPLLAAMVVALTREIATAVSVQFDLDTEVSTRLGERMLAEGRYFGLIAQVGGRPAGFAGLSEGHALFAGGVMGTIQELYVDPDYRSHRVGAALLDAATVLARKRGWQRLEVCTPPLPQFDRSLAFYQREGFAITGGRKLRKLT